MELKSHEKRFGMVAMGKGYITLEQLIEAMRIQVKEDAETGKHRLIGQILIEMNAISPSQVMKVLDSLDRI